MTTVTVNSYRIGRDGDESCAWLKSIKEGQDSTEIEFFAGTQKMILPTELVEESKKAGDSYGEVVAIYRTPMGVGGPAHFIQLKNSEGVILWPLYPTSSINPWYVRKYITGREYQDTQWMIL